MSDLEIDALAVVDPQDGALLWGQAPASAGGTAQRIEVQALALRAQLDAANTTITQLESRIAVLEGPGGGGGSTGIWDDADAWDDSLTWSDT